MTGPKKASISASSKQFGDAVVSRRQWRIVAFIPRCRNPNVIECNGTQYE